MDRAGAGALLVSLIGDAPAPLATTSHAHCVAGTLLADLTAGADLSKVHTPVLAALLTAKGVEVPKGKGERKDAVLRLLGGAGHSKLKDLVTWHRVTMEAAAAPLLRLTGPTTPSPAATVGALAGPSGSPPMGYPMAI